MSDLQRFSIKLFVETGEDTPLATFIPVFHRWIQNRVLEGVWIDVADYSHVPQGPGILLIGHEAHVAIDDGGGRRGLLVTRKQPSSGSLRERLEALARTAFETARLLEEAPELGGRLRFGIGEIELVLNDRLRAPNREETLVALRPEIEAFVSRLLGTLEASIGRDPDPRERLTIRIRVSGADEGLGQWLQRNAA